MQTNAAADNDFVRDFLRYLDAGRVKIVELRIMVPGDYSECKINVHLK